MKRWLVLTLGLGVAAIAVLSLLGVDIGSDAANDASQVSAEPQHAEPHHAVPHHGEIDQKSRDRMLAILREAESEGADAR